MEENAKDEPSSTLEAGKTHFRDEKMLNGVVSPANTTTTNGHVISITGVCNVPSNKLMAL